MRRLGVAAAVIVTLLATLTALLTIRLAPSPAVLALDEPAAFRPLGLALSVALTLTCWLTVKDQPWASTGLTVVGLAWLLPALAAWPRLSPSLRAWQLAAAPLGILGVAIVVAGWRRAPAMRSSALIAVCALAPSATLVHLVGYDPFLDRTCIRTCQESSAVLADWIGLHASLGVVVLLMTSAAGISLLTCLRTRTSPRTVRFAGAASCVLLTLAVALPWLGAGQDDRRPDSAASWLELAGVTAITAAALGSVLHTRTTRRKILTIFRQLDDPEGTLATATPMTAIHVAVPGEDRWVDAFGAPATDPSRSLVLHDADGPAVRLVFRQHVDPDQVRSAVTPTTRLALDNLRLDALCRLRLNEVVASQRRIVEAIDLERHRMERDLHDGAQQPLVAVAMHLRLARNRGNPTTQSAVAVAEEHVREALAALRAITHGTFPAALAEAGLEAALDELASASPLTVTLTTPGLPPLPLPVELAAYRSVSTTLDAIASDPDASTATVLVFLESDQLVLAVSGNDRGMLSEGQVSDLADRVTACGGTMDPVSSGPGGSALTVRLPCAS